MPKLCPAPCKAAVMQSDGHGGRKQHNYDEMQQACSVITKQTADLWRDPGLEPALRSYEKPESDSKSVGTSPPGVILYILSLYTL